MSTPIPEFDSLAQGEGYANVPAPTSDAADTAGWSDSQIPNVPQGSPSPVEAVSLATLNHAAPNLSQTWSSGDKGTNWMGNPSYPTSKTGTEPVA